MWSTAELWRNGAQVWSVEHDAQNGMCHISSSGLLPDGYSAIETDFTEKQEEAGGEDSDTDYFFEIPLQTAKSIVGFKHNESGPENVDFLVFNNTLSKAAAVAIYRWREEALVETLVGSSAVSRTPGNGGYFEADVSYGNPGRLRTIRIPLICCYGSHTPSRPASITRGNLSRRLWLALSGQLTRGDAQHLIACSIPGWAVSTATLHGLHHPLRLAR